MKHVLMTAATAMTLIGCSAKPPGCGEGQTIDAVKGLIKNEVQSALTNGEEYQLDPLPINAFLNDLSMGLEMITTDGYNEQAKRHSCHGRLTVSIGTTAQEKFDIDFSTQATQDKPNDFLVQVEQGQTIIDKAKNSGMMQWLAQRFNGNWQGTYSCDALDGDATGSKGGFKQDVTMVVGAETKAKLERTAKGGGIEQLTGYISPDGHLELQGIGKNTPDDTWMTIFSGSVKADGISADGRLTDPQGDRILRNCHLSLKRLQP